MEIFWYRQPIQSREFKEGLKQERLFRLYMLLASLIKEEGEGQKVKSKINTVRKEIGRRKGS